MGTSRVTGLYPYFLEHIRSYRVRLPYYAERNHLKRLREWHDELIEWAEIQRSWIQIHPKPLGDPHSPGGARASRLIVGPSRLNYIWKPGKDRFVIEQGLQEMIDILGPTSGLVPVNGMSMAGGGAWRKIKFDHVDDKKDKKIAGVAAAHILLLIACFNLPDLHHENFVWTKKGFRIIDGEFFCGPTWVSSARSSIDDRRYLIAERMSSSVFPQFIASRYGGDKFVELIMDNLDSALATFQKKWNELYQIRKKLNGLEARIIHRGTIEYARLMPFLMSKRYYEAAVQEFNRHVPPDFDRKSACDDLRNGCIPIHRGTIGRHDDPINGALYPDEVMLKTIKAQLLPGVLATKPTILTLSEILQSVKVDDNLRRNEPAYGTLAIGGIVGDSAPIFDDPGLCHGFGGLVLLHAAEKHLGLPHSIEGSQDVWDSHLQRMAKAKLNHGINIGVAGDFMLGWALNELGELSSGHLQMLDSRLEYLHQLEGRALDIATGLAGDLLGLVRASSYLPGRAQYIRSTAKKIITIIETEYIDSIKAGVLYYGFAHGLAGVALALVQAERELGIESEVKEDIVKKLKKTASDKTERKRLFETHAFCYNEAGVDAVLRYVDESDFEWSHSEYEYPNKYGKNEKITNLCCGVGAYHLGRIRGIGSIKSSSPCQTTSVWGYYGIAGYKYLEINEKSGEKLPDPIWGRPLLRS